MKDLAAVAKRLDEWFSTHARDLPWRAAHDPYHVLLAEFILQQTRMETGLPYFERIVKRFPTLASLAAAKETEILALWSGLGYYRRARNLHQAARTIVERHAGRIPHTVPDLLELPGIGPYTAGAIASIAFDRPEPSLDGNQLRVFSRLLGLPPDVNAARRRRIEEAARTWLAHGSPRRTNQALMDLGSSVCLPENPRCGECPLASVCAGRTRIRPRPRAAASRPVEYWVALACRKGDRLWLEAPKATGLLAGLWLPPLRETRPSRGPEAFRQVYSHKTWRVRVRNVRAAPTGRGRWVRSDELADLPHARLTERVMRIAFGSAA